MPTRSLTSSMYRVVPIAPVESDGAAFVSRWPAQFRTKPGASAAGAGADARRAAAALAAAFWAAYTRGSGTLSGTAPTGRARTPAGAGWLARSTGTGWDITCGWVLAPAAPADTSTA